ncbi:uncharacterized protein APUU_80506S [Aspergillus puulaauensis]|uniref:Uncharacterized protein n=1 Tax=Aspergillus puulaauensis TaxID=1220207 RepID=A0A7R8AUT2_9EURO|nr:uncharacterized protein APUU_80506S [Aspergillus puulaauensis]BCS30203.1 hypothetical protein APUU_80506S [Aspergillus puulaauensis]
MQECGFRGGHSIPAELVVSMGHEKVFELLLCQSGRRVMQRQRVAKPFHLQFFYIGEGVCLAELFVFEIIGMLLTRSKSRIFTVRVVSPSTVYWCSAMSCSRPKSSSSSSFHNSASSCQSDSLYPKP